MTPNPYDRSHRKLREQWARTVAAGDAFCCRCGYPIEPGGDFHLDHDHTLGDPSAYAGVSHPVCNVTEGNHRRAHRRLITERRPTFITEDGDPVYWSRRWLASARRFEEAR